jgi:hypothetical protein
MDGTLAGFTPTEARFRPTLARTSLRPAGSSAPDSKVGSVAIGDEYLYIDLGTISGSAALLTSSPALLFVYNSDITDQILRISLNLRL